MSQPQIAFDGVAFIEGTSAATIGDANGANADGLASAIRIVAFMPLGADAVSSTGCKAAKGEEIKTGVTFSQNVLYVVGQHTALHFASGPTATTPVMVYIETL